jgi:hypothetical protein
LHRGRSSWRVPPKTSRLFLEALQRLLPLVPAFPCIEPFAFNVIGGPRDVPACLLTGPDRLHHVPLAGGFAQRHPRTPDAHPGPRQGSQRRDHAKAVGSARPISRMRRGSGGKEGRQDEVPQLVAAERLARLSLDAKGIPPEIDRRLVSKAVLGGAGPSGTHLENSHGTGQE